MEYATVKKKLRPTFRSLEPSLEGIKKLLVESAVDVAKEELHHRWKQDKGLWTAKVYVLRIEAVLDYMFKSMKRSTFQ